MSAEMRPYVVQQGDYLAKLAFVHGFDAEEAWQHAKNDEIRGRRPDHHLLAPGDIVYLPVRAKEGLSIVKGTTNKYRAKVPKVTVHLVFKSEDGKPLAGEPYTLHGLGDPVAGVLDADGALSFDASVLVREVSLALPDRGLVHAVRIGDLDPIDEASGERMRFAHLGRLRHAGEDDRWAASRAIAAFQVEQGIEPTGSVDDATRDALKKAHGS